MGLEKYSFFISFGSIIGQVTVEIQNRNGERQEKGRGMGHAAVQSRSRTVMITVWDIF